tara:strand:- start:3486 stop:4013 length:528 start_codon:yes stop_codon:yes gene_type:complete
MENFRLLTTAQIRPFKNKVKLFKQEDWDEFSFRQKSYKVHRNTETIPLIFDTDFRSDNPTYLEKSSLFKDEIDLCKKIFTKVYGPGLLIRAILVKLKANCSVDPHIDRGNSLQKCFRVHIPVITNENVYFTVGNETKIFKEGEFWEINNSGKVHSVANKSNKGRVNLIADWITQD